MLIGKFSKLFFRQLSHLPLALLATPILGNDSTAGFANGELVLKVSPQISMESEVLELSAELVAVTYVFQNLSKSPITSEIAFPLPAVFLFPMSDQSEVSGFKVRVEGKDVQLEKEVKFSKGCKLSERDLKEIGDPLLGEILKKGKIVKGDQLEVLRKKLSPLAGELGACIMVQETYHWTQSFPPGRLQTYHEYKPSTGRYWGEKGKVSANSKTFCIDKGTSSAILKVTKSAEYPTYQTISYILKTGRNWSGPIKSFTLKIKKPSSASVLSVCMDGLKKVGDSEFSVTKKNFLPKDDLHVLLVSSAN